MFIVKTMAGDRFKITGDEYKAAIGGDGLLVFSSCGISIAKSRIESIFPESMAGEIEKKVDRTKQMEGFTPEGDAVVKRFGRWYVRDCHEGQRDEDGNSLLEYTGNPLLPTPEEYEREFKQLPPTEWCRKLTGRSSEGDDRLLLDRDNRTSPNGLTKIGT